jgi:hypothetical protein
VWQKGVVDGNAQTNGNNDEQYSSPSGIFQLLGSLVVVFHLFGVCNDRELKGRGRVSRGYES